MNVLWWSFPVFWLFWIRICLGTLLVQVPGRFWKLGPWSFRWNVWRPPPSTYLKVSSHLMTSQIFYKEYHAILNEGPLLHPCRARKCHVPLMKSSSVPSAWNQWKRETGIGSVGLHSTYSINQLSLMTLPCCHAFHDACVTAWLGKAANCPLCRFYDQDIRCIH